MEVAKVLNVPIEDVFDAITLSFRQDYYAWIMDKVFAVSVKKKIEAQLTGLESFAKTTSQQINTRK